MSDTLTTPYRWSELPGLGIPEEGIDKKNRAMAQRLKSAMASLQSRRNEFDARMARIATTGLSPTDDDLVFLTHRTAIVTGILRDEISLRRLYADEWLPVLAAHYEAETQKAQAAMDSFREKLRQGLLALGYVETTNPEDFRKITEAFYRQHPEYHRLRCEWNNSQHVVADTELRANREAVEQIVAEVGQRLAALVR